MIFRFETEDGVLRVIRHPDICADAEFKLDKPHILRAGDLFELLDGAWYTVSWSTGERVRTPVEGRWKVLSKDG